MFGRRDKNSKSDENKGRGKIGEVEEENEAHPMTWLARQSVGQRGRMEGVELWPELEKEGSSRWCVDLGAIGSKS